MRTYRFLLILVAALACSSSPDSNNPGGTSGTTIGTGGGTVTSSDGNVQLTIPAGALSTQVSFSIVKDTATAPGAGSALVTGSVYDFEPSGTTFATPATIRIPYQASQLPVGTNPLFLSVYLRQGATWDSIPSTLDTVAHVVTAAVSHFSDYGLCAGPCLLPPSGFVRMGFYPGCCSVLPVGGQITVTGAMEWNNTQVSAQVTLGDLPQGVTGSAQVGAQSAGCPSLCSAPVTVTLRATADATPGRYDIPVNVATGGGVPVTGLSTISISVNALPGFALSTSPPSLPLAQGGSATAAVSIVRTNFTAPVSLSATGLPTGVTATFSSPTLSGATLGSTVTFTATAAVPAGSTNVMIHASGSGATDQTDTITLVVAPFALAAGPASGTTQAGGSATFGVKATRAGGFNTAITYAVTGLPAGATATFASTSVADSSKLTIAVGGAVAAGLYSLEITGTAGSVTQQTPVNLVVTASGGGLRLDFSTCATPPIWLAVQDSTGPWTQVTASGGVYQLPLPATQHVGLAIVGASGSTFSTSVVYLSASELAQFATVGARCAVAPQTFTGTVIGTDSVDDAFAFLSMGGGSSAARSDGPFLVTAPPGTHDAIGYLERKELALSDSDKFVINRNVTTPGTINFNAGTTVPMTTVSVQGSSTGDCCGVTMFYASHGCEENEMYTTSSSLPTFSITGVPTSLQLPGDLHVLEVSDLSGSVERFVTTMFHTLTAVTPALGTSISPVVTALTSPYKRLSVSLPSLPPEYSALLVDGMSQSGGPSEIVTVSRNYLGSDSVKVTMPDLTGVTGFSSAWEPSPSATLNTIVQSTSMPYGQQSCSDGLIIKTASVSGSQ